MSPVFSVIKQSSTRTAFQLQCRIYKMFTEKAGSKYAWSKLT